MANFQVVQTNAGVALLAKCLNGAELQFAKIVMGDSAYSGSYAAVTAVITPKIELPISKITLKTESAVLRAVLSFSDITEGFTWREIGLYAADPDTGAQVLYAYGNAGDEGDYIPDGSSTTLAEKRINITAVTSNAANVTAVIDESLIFASKEELDAKLDVTVLEAEATARAQADSDLQSALQAETQARQDADSALQTIVSQINAVVEVQVAAGQTISAKDVVNIIDGFAGKEEPINSSVSSKNNISDRTVQGTFYCAMLSENKIVLNFTTDGVTSFVTILIVNDDGSIENLTSNYGCYDYCHGNIAVLSESAFVLHGTNSSNAAYMIACTISGSTITLGTLYTYSTLNIHSPIICAVSSTKIVLVCYDQTNYVGKYMVVTVSGTTLSFGSLVAPTTESYIVANMFAVDTTRICLLYRGRDNNLGYAQVGYVSGSIITWGTAVVYTSTYTGTPNGVMIDTNKCLVATGGFSGYIGIGVISGSAISFPNAFQSIDPTTSGAVQTYGCVKLSDFPIVVIEYANTSTYYLTYVLVDLDIANNTVTVRTPVVIGTTSNSGYHTCCKYADNDVFLAYNTTSVKQIQKFSLVTSQDALTEAIALDDGDGDNSDIIQVIFDGKVKLDGVTKGEEITSDGVTAYCPYDGLLCVEGYWKH